jgi:hypothetical protein
MSWTILNSSKLIYEMTSSFDLHNLDKYSILSCNVEESQICGLMVIVSIPVQTISLAKKYILPDDPLVVRTKFIMCPLFG